MSTDEIRTLVATWMAATKAGDTAKVLSLMTADVVFLIPGRPPMIGRDAFAAASAPPPGVSAPQIDGTSEIQEVIIAGDWAFMWTKLRVVVTPPGEAKITRAGHTLTVLKKESGRWLLARDANLLTVVPE